MLDISSLSKRPAKTKSTKDLLTYCQVFIKLTGSSATQKALCIEALKFRNLVLMGSLDLGLSRWIPYSPGDETTQGVAVTVGDEISAG